MIGWFPTSAHPNMGTLQTNPLIVGTGLITLDIVISAATDSPLRAWTGGTCGNVLSILSYLGWHAMPLARLNGDFASKRVISDMKRWGVDINYIQCPPTTHTPIVIQEIRKVYGNKPSHHFIWRCPNCGHTLPSFKPITKDVQRYIDPMIYKCSVFFMDRLSRAVLEIAEKVRANGGIVFFEPSMKGNLKLFEEALQLSHIIKYSNQRFHSFLGNTENAILEIQTLGNKGLRWRHKLGRKRSRWIHENAFEVPEFADSCGCGDWCSAGIISKLCRTGIVQLKHCDEQEVKSGINFGQILASWNCRFEGARGGMYAVPGKEDFLTIIEQLCHGSSSHPTTKFDSPSLESISQIFCPACENYATNCAP